MTVPKLKDKDLEKLQQDSEKAVKERVVYHRHLSGYIKHYHWVRHGQIGLKSWKEINEILTEKLSEEADKRVYFARLKLTLKEIITDESFILRFKDYTSALEPYFEGNQTESSALAKQTLKNFRYYNELTIQAFEYFDNHLKSSEFTFSADIYRQWLAALRLGFYTAPDYVVLGRQGINYPDLRNNPSPRLGKLKAYLTHIYRCRVLVEIFDEYLTNWKSSDNTTHSISLEDWNGYLEKVRKQLNASFNSQKAQQLFKEIFGSDNPPPPATAQLFQAYQQQAFDRIAKALLGDKQETEPEQDGFNRDYVKEERERTAREKEERDRKDRERAEHQEEQKQWTNLHPDFADAKNRVDWTNRNFSLEEVRDWINIGLKPSDSEFAEFLKKEKKLTPEQVLNEGDLGQLKEEFRKWKTKPPESEKPKEERKREPSPSRKAAQEEKQGESKPPKETNFNSSDLNDALNKLKEGLEQDGKENHPSPLPDLGLGPIGIMSGDKEKLPWLCVGVNLSKDIYKSVGAGGMERMPFWKVLDPANLAISHGSGDIITLLLELFAVESNFSDVYHNIFWAKNPDKKGFQRLVKDDTLPAEREKEREQLLIAGNRGNDPRADKLGWKSWFWAKNGKVSFGVPGVKQKSWRLTRWMRTGDKAYDLDDTNHFVGILKSKGLLGGFRTFNFGRVADWGSAPKRSVLWITNQLNYSYSKNKDWAGDDIQTINPQNGYSHYLLFSDLTTEQIQKKYVTNSTPALNCKNLAELVGKITQEGKGTLVRLGPDALELINSQNKEQKERSQNETPQSRENNQKAVSDQDLADIGISRADFEALNTPFTDEAKIANLIKQISKSNNPQKIAELLNKLFDYCQPATREAIFNQMVDNNPVFSKEEKENLKNTWKQAQTTADKKKVWETLTSHQAQREAFQKKTKEQKDNIFEEQVNNNPRYGPPGEDTQERRDRFKEYEQANDTKKEQMQAEENEQFAQGENANQWGNYFSDNANRTAGAGDEGIGSTTDNNFDGKFSWQGSLENVYKLKDLIASAPREMKEGMQANQPYWQVVMYHPLTYIFVFMGMLMAILASVTKKK